MSYDIIIYNNDEIKTISCPITSYPTLGLHEIMQKLKHILQNDISNMYIIGIVYTKNNIISDFQPNITEKQIGNENAKDKAWRGIKEELQIDIKKEILEGLYTNTRGPNFQVNHYIRKITETDYTYVESVNKIEGYNNKKKKSSIILYGNLETLIHIIKNWKAENKLESEANIYSPCIINAENIIKHFS